MNIWNTEQLAIRLANDEIDEKQKAYYYIATFYLSVCSAVFPMYLLDYSYSINWITFSSFVATTATFHLGVMKVFRACLHHKKATVLDTLVILSLPISIKIQIGSWVFYFLFSYIAESGQFSVLYWVLYTFLVMPMATWLLFHFVKVTVDKCY